MTDDFDVSLRRRLESLASAVPVARPGEVTAVVRQPVRARSTSRLALAGFLPVLAVVVIGAIVAGVLKVGPGPGDSSAGSTEAANGPIESTTRSGDFEVTIRAGKARYAVDEPIDIEASLAYLGAALSIDIGHAYGADQTPLAFGIEEPVRGDLRLEATWETICTRSTVQAGRPIVAAFRKMGGWSDPDDGTFFLDPVLRLPEGIWHVYVDAWFSIADGDDFCSDPIKVRAAIAIEVAGQLRSAPPSDGPSVARATNGDFELTLTADKARYQVDEPIEVEASLTYRGDEPVTIRHGYGAAESPIGFGIEEPVLGGLVLGPITHDICAASILEPGQPLTVQFGKAFTFDPDDPRADEYRAFGQDPVLALSEGAWHVYAVAGFSINTCSPDPIVLRAEIVIEVVRSDPAESEGPMASTSAPSTGFLTHIPLLTSDQQDPICDATEWGGWLASNEASGIGVELDRGDLRAVQWPSGWTGWRDGLDVVLMNADGREVGRSGNLVTFDGYANQDVVFACSRIYVIPEARLTIELTTAPIPTLGDGTPACDTAIGIGYLSIQRTGLGVLRRNGDPLEIIWPEGYSARVGFTGKAQLLDPQGKVVAREEDLVTFTGGDTAYGAFFACSAIAVLEEAALP